MNLRAIWAIYYSEMARTARTLMQSVASPVLSTSLYFVVFGGAIGSRIPEIDGVSYGAFIVPGLIMLTLLTQSTSNASFGIYFPKFIGTIYELLSAPVSYLEIVIGYVGAAATKSIILGLIILVTAAFFVDVRIDHPLAMVLFLVLTVAHLLPPRLHHRHLGEGLRAAPDRAAPHHHAARLPRRHLLLDQHAAAVLADRVRLDGAQSFLAAVHADHVVGRGADGVQLGVGLALALVIEQHDQVQIAESR